MLKSMRKNAKYFYFLLFIVIISFVFWGFNPGGDTPEKVIVAEVGDDVITRQEFWIAHKNLESNYRDIYAQQLSQEELRKKIEELDLKEQALNLLLTDRLLQQAARDIDLGVTNQELENTIKEVAAFQQDGTFSSEQYKAVLRNSGYTIVQYEDLKRRELLNNKMRSLIEDSAMISDEEVDADTDNEDLRKFIINSQKENYKAKLVESFINGLKKSKNVIIYRDNMV